MNYLRHTEKLDVLDLRKFFYDFTFEYEWKTSFKSKLVLLVNVPAKTLQNALLYSMHFSIIHLCLIFSKNMGYMNEG